MADPKIRFTPEMHQLREYILKHKANVEQARTQVGVREWNRTPDENRRVGFLAAIDWMLYYLNDMARALPIVPDPPKPVHYVMCTRANREKYVGQFVHTHDECPIAVERQAEDCTRMELLPVVRDAVIWYECAACVEHRSLLQVSFSITAEEKQALGDYLMSVVHPPLDPAVDRGLHKLAVGFGDAQPHHPA